MLLPLHPAGPHLRAAGPELPRGLLLHGGDGVLRPRLHLFLLRHPGPRPVRQAGLAPARTFDHPEEISRRRRVRASSLIDTAQGYLEAWLPVLCCLNICGRVQLAKELDIDWKNTDKMKAQASESAEQLKSDAMLRA